MIRRETITVEASGGAGTATGSGRTNNVISGVVLSVHLDYSASMAATSDVTIAEAGNNAGAAVPVLTVANNATDGWYHPRSVVNGVADGAAISGGYGAVAVSDHVSVDVAQANDGDSVTVTLVWDDLR